MNKMSLYSTVIYTILFFVPMQCKNFFLFVNMFSVAIYWEANVLNNLKLRTPAYLNYFISRKLVKRHIFFDLKNSLFFISFAVR